MILDTPEPEDNTPPQTISADLLNAYKEHTRTLLFLLREQGRQKLTATQRVELWEISQKEAAEPWADAEYRRLNFDLMALVRPDTILSDVPTPGFYICLACLGGTFNSRIHHPPYCPTCGAAALMRVDMRTLDPLGLPTSPQEEVSQ